MTKDDSTNVPAIISSIPAMNMDLDEIISLISDSLGNEELTPRDLEKLTVPGATDEAVWTVAGMNGEEKVKELAGVILMVGSRRDYWADPYQPGQTTPPNCTSSDGVSGEGNPGGPCEACPMNKFESAPVGKGKACKESRSIFFLRSGSLLPTVISTPPTSLKSWKQYLVRLTGWGKRPQAVITKLGLDGSGNYPQITFTTAGELDIEQFERVSAYANALKPSFDRADGNAPDQQGERPDFSGGKDTWEESDGQ